MSEQTEPLAPAPGRMEPPLSPARPTIGGGFNGERLLSPGRPPTQGAMMRRRPLSPPPFMRPGARPLHGIGDFPILQMQARITALAAANTFNSLAKIEHTGKLPKAEKFRSRGQVHRPQAALLQPPAKAQPRRKGVNWQTAVLSEAAYCFEDLAEADQLSGADELVHRMSAAEREAQARQRLTEAEALFGSSSAQLAPALCGLGCAIVRATVAAGGNVSQAAEEAAALGTRAAKLLGADIASPPPVRRLRDLVDVAPILARLGELSYMLEAHGEHPSSVCMQRWRRAIAHMHLDDDALRRSATVADLAQSLLRSTARPDPTLVKIAPPRPPALDLHKAISAQPTTTPPSSPDPGSPKRRGGSCPSSTGSSKRTSCRSSLPPSARPPSARAPSAARSPPSRPSSATMNGHTSCGARSLDADTVIADDDDDDTPCPPTGLRPREAQLFSPPVDDEDTTHGTWDDPDDAATLIQRRVRRRTGLRFGLSTWREAIVRSRARKEKANQRQERAGRMQLLRDAALHDALAVLDEAVGVLTLHEMRDEPRPASERAREDGKLRPAELHRRILAARAEALEGLGSLEEAIDALHELHEQQEEAMLGARDVVTTLAKLVDLIRRSRPRREAVIPLKRLLTAERSLRRPLTAGGIRLPSGANSASAAAAGGHADGGAGGDGRRGGGAEGANPSRASRHTNPDPRLAWRSMADVVAAELLEVYMGEGMLDEAIDLMFSAASPVPKSAQQLLEDTVVRMQRGYRMRRDAVSRIAAGERGRLERMVMRHLRHLWASATYIQARARGRMCRVRLANEAEQRRLDGAAKVLQTRHRTRLEGRKPQWPWRLTIMAMRAQKRRETARAELDSPETGQQRTVAPDKVKGEGVAVSRSLSIMATKSQDRPAGSMRAWDPRGGA